MTKQDNNQALETNDSRVLVIVAAGTGGHVMPGLAVARVMRARGWKIEWIGTTTGMEGGLVAREEIPFHPLNFQGVRGKGLSGAILGLLKMVKAIWQSRSILKKIRPDLVFSTGGYVAVPVGFAAQSIKRPIVLMNCDADILMSTNTLMPFTDALACGFAGGARTFAGPKGHTTGNPVRAEIAAVPAPEERFAGREGPLKLFVFGGSLGAQVLNDVIPEALALIPEEKRPVVLHQTGRNRDKEVREHYEKLGVKAEVVPFIDDMAARYRESDLVICRSGATSCSELCAAGAAAVLVPFIAKTTRHQLGNARYLADRGAAVLVEQSGFTAEKAAELIGGMTREKALGIAKAARAIAAPDAAGKVADLIEQTLAARIAAAAAKK
ncbi:undecaprenyldiphospho-muramoylpentapeptide beta-N-acetylglucosaminyltransferase [Sutterella sp.]|uniref:undecaprenyldiphospho-muramoylpentapeptide beta-N-acetylglucosaminyltransferase n=1 Tax=Sutterella sp. TaxID=1981025 RepID=UPI0026E05C7D|nr:undecaprenyldiphospho-muramoylpentapeptide beta-N-acetylglucosaminyltransferase [Sutterella sp.]MDO5530835.1 undecaprenyldiphospho-muramoylpentapeptide beta-N-acetylglucosaminyltransferase [Sutterella sp.]